MDFPGKLFRLTICKSEHECKDQKLATSFLLESALKKKSQIATHSECDYFKIDIIKECFAEVKLFAVLGKLYFSQYFAQHAYDYAYLRLYREFKKNQTKFIFDRKTINIQIISLEEISDFSLVRTYHG